MQITRRWQLSAVAVLTVAGLALGVAPAANADPPSGTNPVIDGFGSDTTQDVLNGLSAAITSGGSRVIASYNAGTGLITGTLRPGETTPVDVPRANGSGQGKTLLNAAIDGTTPTLNGVTASGPLARDDVEFSRSSSEGTWAADGRLNYLPFAVDAVSYARHNSAGTAIPANLPVGATVGEQWSAGRLKLTLKNIYGLSAGTGTITLFSAASGGISRTVGDQASGAQIVPFVPQINSGTRSFWQDAILGNPTTGAIAPFGNHVKDVYTAGGTSTSVQEHDGSVLAALPTRAIAPFSIAQFIAQGRTANLNTWYGITVPDRRNGAALGTINGVATTVGGNLNPAFPVKRAVFNVVARDAITPGQPVYNAQLDTLFSGASASVLTADRPGASTALVINDFGFGTIPAAGVTIATAANGTNTYLPGDEGYRSN